MNEESQPALSQITERETQILRLMAKGQSNKQIAANLGLSIETIKTHIRNILSKLKARGRTEAAVIAMSSGLLKQEEASSENLKNSD